MYYFIFNDYTQWFIDNFKTSQYPKYSCDNSSLAENLNITGRVVMTPSCHANFKLKLNQVSTNTGEQYLDIGQQGKIPPGLERCPLEAEKAHHYT